MTKYQIGTDLGKEIIIIIIIIITTTTIITIIVTLVARARFSIYKSILLGLSKKDIQIFSTRKTEFPVNLYYFFPTETTYLIFHQDNYFTDIFNVI